MTTEDDFREEVERMAERFRVSPEVVEAVLSAKRATDMYGKLDAFEREKALIRRGDPDAIRRQHEQGRLTARERVDRLFDPGSFEELDLWQGGGIIMGHGEVHGRPVSAFSQDATVRDELGGRAGGNKMNTIIENAINARTPIVEIFDSGAGSALDAVRRPDFFTAARMAKSLTVASGVIPKIALVMGECSGDLAIVAGLADFTFMVRNASHMHIVPPPHGMTAQELGGAWNVHAKVTGCCDVLAENDEDCLEKCRQLLSYLPSSNVERPPVADTGDDPNRRTEEFMELVPVNSAKPYSMYRLLSLLVDSGNFFEIKSTWTKNLIVGLGRLDGHTVGIIASNPQDKAGTLNLDAADKMSRHVRFCDAFNIPIVWITDTPAFLPAVEEETRGLIRHGAGCIMANSEATVPQVNVTIRKKYGGGGLAMPTTNLGGDIGVAWPTFESGIMGASGAVAIRHSGQLGQTADEAKRIEEERRRMEEEQWRLDMGVRTGTQMIIDPRDTRPYLIRTLRWLRNRRQEWAPRRHENIRI